MKLSKFLAIIMAISLIINCVSTSGFVLAEGVDESPNYGVDSELLAAETAMLETLDQSPITYSTDSSSNIESLPERVDISEDLYFPPIGDQGNKGSCTFFATCYYQFTNAKNRLNGTYARTTELDPIKQNIASPAYLYNLIHYATPNPAESGSTFEANEKLLREYGCVSLTDLPYSDTISNTFPSEDAMRAALNTRISGTQDPLTITTSATDKIVSPNSSKLNEVKSALNRREVLTVYIYANGWSYWNHGLTDKGEKIIYQCNIPVNEGTNHAMAVVGYDDTIWCDINNNEREDAGEHGAFKLANSWGTQFGNDGFVWLSYDALNTVSAVDGIPNPVNGRRTPAFTIYNGTTNVFRSIRVSECSPKFILKLNLSVTDFLRLIKLGRNNLEDNVIDELYLSQGSEYAQPATYTWFFDYSELNEPFEEYYTGYTWSFEATNYETCSINSAMVVDDKGNVIQQFENIEYAYNEGDPIPYGYKGSGQINLTIGDVDYNGVINNSDANCILRHLTGTTLLSKVQLYLADVNGNGTVETADVRALSTLLENSNEEAAAILSSVNELELMNAIV